MRPVRDIVVNIGVPDFAPAAVSTGLPALDAVTGGIRPGALWVLTGEPIRTPGILASQWAADLAVDHDLATAFIAPDEDAGAVGARLIASRSGIPLPYLLTARPLNAVERRAREAVRAELSRSRMRVSCRRDGTDLLNALAQARQDGSLHAVVVDSDMTPPAGGVLEALRAVADTGALTVAALPQASVLTHPPVPATATVDPAAHVRPEWSQAADVVLVLRPRTSVHAGTGVEHPIAVDVHTRDGGTASIELAYRARLLDAPVATAV